MAGSFVYEGGKEDENGRASSELANNVPANAGGDATGKRLHGLPYRLSRARGQGNPRATLPPCMKESDAAAGADRFSGFFWAFMECDRINGRCCCVCLEAGEKAGKHRWKGITNMVLTPYQQVRGKVSMLPDSLLRRRGEGL